MKANKELYNDLVEFGVTRMGEWGGHYLSDNHLRHITGSVRIWITLYDGPFWDFINPLAVAFYDFLEKSYNYFHPALY